jgi:two-component system torCAD operon response regulator TorR
MSEAQVACLLIVEDEPITRSQLTAHFEKENFKVVAQEDAAQVNHLIESENVDVCLIDINLPGKDGLTLTREIRADFDVGIILVTGKDEQIDKIVGLESGADDYVTKPFDPRELLSRVKNLVRRVHNQEKQKEKGFQRQFESWTLDLNKRELVTPGGNIQSLSAGEFHLVLALIDNAGQVMTRDQLMNRIRNREWYPDDRYIDVLVGQVRRKFRKHDPKTTFISTIHGTGYLFAPDVK